MMRPGSVFQAALLACCGLMFAAGSSNSLAQQQAGGPSGLPGWVVLVLQPVGGDRVRPVTGVVIAAEGLVIVPMDFAAPGDQLIVLDGGTDIIANGRAAVVSKQLPQVGLTVLSSPRLQRSPASLSSIDIQPGSRVHLAAFPPAELISQGAAPVLEATEVTPGAAGALGLLKPLPNVSGPLLDDCGNLLGYGSADGLQSMATDKAPAYVWKDQLSTAFSAVPVELREAPCAAGKDAVATGPTETEQPGGETLITPAVAEPGTQGQAGSGGTLEPGIPQGGVASHGSKPWMGWLAIVLLFAVAGVVVAWTRRRFRRKPAMASLFTDSGGLPPRTRTPKHTDTPEWAGAADCRLELDGRLANGSAFRATCEVSSAAINAVVGRGTADLAIDSQGVHREHVRLSGSADLLTITDLGSPGGTWINRVPCLKGEIMVIGPEDTIFLGDVSFRVSLQPLGEGR